MTQEQANSLIRTVLTLIGAFLTGGGLHYFFGHVIDPIYWQEITGVLLTLVSIVWSFVTKAVDTEKLQGSVRQVLTFVCGILVAKGLLNDQTTEAILAFVGSMLPYILAGLQRTQNAQLKAGNISPQQLVTKYTKR